MANDRTREQQIHSAAGDAGRRLASQAEQPRRYYGRILTDAQLRRAGWCRECKREIGACDCDVPPPGYARP